MDTSQVLCNLNFNVLKFGCISDPEVQTFITKLHEAVMNSNCSDVLVDDLLHIAKLNAFPL